MRIWKKITKSTSLILILDSPYSKRNKLKLECGTSRLRFLGYQVPGHSFWFSKKDWLGVSKSKQISAQKWFQ